jgi:hypothetical protein
MVSRGCESSLMSWWLIFVDGKSAFVATVLEISWLSDCLRQFTAKPVANGAVLWKGQEGPGAKGQQKKAEAPR